MADITISPEDVEVVPEGDPFVWHTRFGDIHLLSRIWVLEPTERPAGLIKWEYNGLIEIEPEDIFVGDE